MTKGHIVVTLAGVIVGSAAWLAGQMAGPVQTAPQLIRSPRETGIKYQRDSEEYATLTRQIYRAAGEAVGRFAQTAGSSPWAVVMDIDETTLDNSVYQLERATYEQPFDTPSWNAFTLRHDSAVVPGVVEFIAGVRRLGGRVAWITNREPISADATRLNLQQYGLWHADDRLCVLDSAVRPKRVRRAEVVAGRGVCAWPGTPMRVAAFVGDQLSDFPTRDENIPGAGDDASFGRVSFLLPNAMYGAWTSAPTRVR